MEQFLCPHSVSLLAPEESWVLSLPSSVQRLWRTPQGGREGLILTPAGAGAEGWHRFDCGDPLSSWRKSPVLHFHPELPNPRLISTLPFQPGVQHRGWGLLSCSRKGENPGNGSKGSTKCAFQLLWWSCACSFLEAATSFLMDLVLILQDFALEVALEVVFGRQGAEIFPWNTQILFQESRKQQSQAAEGGFEALLLFQQHQWAPRSVPVVLG